MDIAGTAITVLTTVPKWLIGQISVRRREMKVSKREGDVLKREQDIERIKSLVVEQQRQPEAFLHCYCSRVFLPAFNETEIAVQVEWFNGTVFPVDIKAVRGEMIMDGINLGHQITIASPVHCDGGRHCSGTFYLQIDKDCRRQLADSKTQCKSHDWTMNTTWEMLMEGSKAPINPQGPNGSFRLLVG